MKKIVCALLAVVMLVALSTAAFAAETPLDVSAHTFSVYQIFAGTQTADADDATIGAVVWGTGINADEFLAALKADKTFGEGEENIFYNCTTAADVAAAMKDWDNSSAEAKAFAKLAEDNKSATAYVSGKTPAELAEYTFDAGYYLVVDTTAGEVDGYNLSLVQLTKKGGFDVVSKASVPNVDKEIKGALKCTDKTEGHTHTADCYNWAASDKKPIGGVEEFKITAHVPATVSDYNYYYFIVKDTLSEGLTLNADSFAVSFVNGSTVTAAAAYDADKKTGDYTLKTGDDASPCSFQLALVNAKAHAGQDVVVSYTATVNEKAIIGVEGNANEVTVKYSNKPDNEYKTSPNGYPAEDSTDPFGETPETITLTYVTEIAVYKVDDNDQPLKDAQFTLTGETMKTVLVYKEYFKEDENGSYYKLKAKSPNGDDQYTTDKPVTENKMEEAAAGATAGYVIDADATGDDVETIGGVKYRPYVPANDAGKTIYVLVKANADKYESTTQKYSKETKFETQDADSSYKVAAFVDESGYVKFTGLEAGEYTLSETKVPSGFNPLPDIKFTIGWTAPSEDDVKTKGTAAKCTWSVTEENNAKNVNYDAEKGTFSITVVNQKGSTLPETGGIGTTIFYVVGSALVVVAAVLLITKKRMHNDA